MPSAVRKIFVCVISLCLAVFLAVECGIVSHFKDDGEPDLDYIIVLGAQVYKNGPSVVLQYRLDKAVEYLEENSNTICIVSGGQGFNEYTAEAYVMRDYLIEKGISEERLICEDQSQNTKQNLINSTEYIDEGATVGLITNNFHMFRALKSAEKHKVHVDCGISAGTTNLYLINNMCREFFGYIKLLLFE